ncbi:hypothetical protein [Candidatus Frankia alpina]|uniref:Uncharacterized protein n=1 Tax=Candidatus Frankia alpina TaxID=2699483 RepID=A0A4S5DYD4_9ACTN|nr:hypothetical protein [Candidatus Frankia alpina]THJ63974.1 hypothetical protein E7Y31_17915 [Candidatus Frankia alpina]
MSGDDVDQGAPVDPVAPLRAALSEVLAVLEGLAPAARAAAAHRARRYVGEDAQRALAVAYADALGGLYARQGSYAAAAAALADAGDALGDEVLAAMDGEAVRQALIRARRAAAATAPPAG